MTRKDFMGRTALFGAAVASGRVFADGQALLGLGGAAHENAAECAGEPTRKIGERNDACAHLAGRPMGNGASFSTAPDMLRFVTDMLRRERFPQA